MDLFVWNKSAMVVAGRYLLCLIMLTSFSLQGDDLNESDEPEVRIIALFENAAMVDFNGKQKIYRPGQNISPQIKLIKANTRLATLLINDEVIELGLTNSSNIRFNQPEKKSQKEDSSQTEKIARIVRNNSGMYMTSGFINGVAVPFLVDTGATTIAMNESYAKLVGLSYKLDSKRGQASTASGVVATWHVTLNKVRVGGIELTNVDAVVIKGNFPQEILLGMSFLNRINLDYDGRLLVLTKKF